MREYAIIIYALDEYNVETKLAFSGYGFVNTDPAGLDFIGCFEARVITPIAKNVDMFTSGTTSGTSQIGYGYLELANTDGGLDYLMNYKLSDRLIAAFYFDLDLFYSTLSEPFVGYISSCEFSTDRLTINVKDIDTKLNKPLAYVTYGGTNVLPDGLDGTDDIKGQVIPILEGKVFNVSPVLVNTSKYIYQVSLYNDTAVDYVYDRGVALTPAATTYSSLIDLEASPPAAGEYKVYSGTGLGAYTGTYFRLGSNPDGIITCDAHTLSSSALPPIAGWNTIEKVVRRLIGSNFVFQNFLGSSTPFQYETGIYITDSITIYDAAYEILKSISGFMVFTDTYYFWLGTLEDVGSTTPDFYFTRNDIISIERTTTNDPDKGIASYKQTIGYAKNYTIQNDSDLATSVPESRKLVLAKEFLSENAVNNAILLDNDLSPEIVKNTYICNKADALTELGRITDIYSVDRVLFKVELPIIGFDPLPKLSNVVNLQLNRFGLDSGKSFRVLGVQYDYPAIKYRLTLWG